MNTVEGILSEVGEGTLSTHDGYKNIILYLNVAIRDSLSVPLNGTETGFSVLMLIYEMVDIEKQKIILSKTIKYDNTKQDRFKLTLTVMMVVIVSIVLFMAASTLILGESLEQESTDILKMILYNLFELVKHILDVSYPTSP